MRGIVSLAAALALPTALPDGAAFPHRPLLIFLTYCVILTTLLMPALTLPALLRWLGVKGDDAHLREETRARIASVKTVLSALGAMRADSRYAVQHIDSLEKRYSRRLKVLESNLTDQPFSPLVDEDQRLRRLLRDVVRLEREALMNLRRAGEIHDEVFHRIARELDLEELRLRTERL
jgi:CPA1 family monovalent cation:H+ antiporter